jgi:beta-lactamase regulating signal transducer with metallopeptidase domain
MLEMLVGAALRTLLLAAVVSLGLRLCRVRNLHVLLTVWTVVLGASLLMPVATRLAAVALPRITLSVPRTAPAESFAAVIQPEYLQSPAPAATPADTAGPPKPFVLPSPAVPPGWHAFAMVFYVVVMAALVARLVVGLALSWRITRSARPVRESWVGTYDVRTSQRIVTPATFGSVILLPPDHATWSPAKRSAVVAHEGAHVGRRDFAVQLAASVNRAIFWFTPLSWWLHRRLSALAEAASDDAAIIVLNDRIGYAEILLDVATRGRALPSGVAMARHATVGARIERILNETTATLGIGWRSRTLMIVGIIPLIVAVAGPLSLSEKTTVAPHSIVALMDPRAPHQRIIIDSQLLEADVGFFEDKATGSVMIVSRDGDHLLTGRIGTPRLAEYPYSEHDFFLTTSAEQNTFIADRNGKVDRVIHCQNGLETTLERITPVRASQLQAAYDRHITEELRPHTQLPITSDVLDKAVGFYALTSTYIFSITREGDQLFVQGTGQKKYPVFPYSDHDFFYTSAAAQLTFVSADGGQATMLILHQDGRDRTAQRVDAAMAQRLQQRLEDERRPHEPMAIAAPLLDLYAGRYAGSAATMIIRRERDHLSAQQVGYNDYPIYPFSDHDFFATTLPAQISFVRDDAGKITGLVRHEHGEDQILSRID